MPQWPLPPARLFAPGYTCANAGECCHTEQTFCAVVGGTRATCCRPSGGHCQESFDCCGRADCCNGVCCGAGQVCCNGVCCALGEHCVSGVCQCMPLQGTCDPNNNLCCQTEPTMCPADNPFGHRNECCRPQGGHCSTSHDCCFDITDTQFGRDTCGDDSICGGEGACCQSISDCVEDRLCIGACFGKGLGFILCDSDADCPPDVDGNATSCRQTRCIDPEDRPI